MSDEIGSVLQVAASGLRAQSARMRIIAENVANASATGKSADEEPYRRKIPVFETELNRVLGVDTVKMKNSIPDMSDFELRHEPGHPAADAQGYVKYPNVNTLTELMDMRAAQRAYEANLDVIENSRAMLTRTLDLLRR